MRNYAVICEFNPFHSGHKYLVDTVSSDADNVVCVMSGQFTQSASPAVCDKSIRAESAVLCGVDAVIELPAVFATASARSFAEGAVKIVSQIKDIKCLAFGAAADRDTLFRLADIKIRKTEEFAVLLKSYLKRGKSYNYASRAAITELYRSQYSEGDPEPVLDDPNSILGIEYICAIDKYCANVRPVIVTRRGEHLSGEYRSELYMSATNIRKALSARDESVKKFIPCNYEKVCDFTEKHAFDVSAYKKSCVFAIKSIEADEIAKLRDCSDGMEFLIKEVVKRSDYDEITNSVMLKTYGAKRIRRLLLDALCKIKKEDADRDFVTRLLACKKEFDFSLLPDSVKTNNRDIKKAAEESAEIKAVLDIDERVTALYNTLCAIDGDYFNYSLVKV